VYVTSFVDRIVVGVLAPALKSDLLLTDTQLGLLGGTAFALLYTSLGIPVGWLADRLNRVTIIATSLAVWSLFTAACGLATGFMWLFLARVGVGVGEAGGTAPAQALLADAFPPGQRARALGIYALGIPLGAYFATKLDWRIAFQVLGAAGLLLAPLVAIALRDPRSVAKGARPGEHLPFPAPREVLQAFAGKSAFWWLAIGAGFSSVFGYALFFWVPSFLVRSHGMALLDVSLYYAAVVLLGGGLAGWTASALADRLGSHHRAAFALVPAGVLMVATPFAVCAVMAASKMLALWLFVVPIAVGLAWIGPVTAAVQHLFPAGTRATAAAAFLLVNSLVGLGLGSPLIGAISDTLNARFGADSLRYALLVALGFQLAGAACFCFASRRVARDWA
jgi:predicted MFS family arabinose efflux permease